MKNNFDLAKAQHEEWLKVWNKTTHSAWKEENNFPSGERFPLGNTMGLSITQSVLILPQLKKYLEEIPIHEFSGAIYGDYKRIESEILNQETEYKKLSMKEQEDCTIQIGSTVVFSGSKLFFVKEEYILASNSSHYTGSTPSHQYVILFRSQKPIEKVITRKGDVERHTLGYIKYI